MSSCTETIILRQCESNIGSAYVSNTVKLTSQVAFQLQTSSEHSLFINLIWNWFLFSEVRFVLPTLCRAALSPPTLNLIDLVKALITDCQTTTEEEKAIDWSMAGNGAQWWLLFLPSCDHLMCYIELLIGWWSVTTCGNSAGQMKWPERLIPPDWEGEIAHCCVNTTSEERSQNIHGRQTHKIYYTSTDQ